MIWKRANRISDEELDWAIRGALRAEMEGVEPSPEVWQRVRAQIENPAADARRRRATIAWQNRAASLFQGAVLAILALGFGLTLNQHDNVTEQAYPQAPDVVYVAAARAGLTYDDDMLSMKRIAQMAQEAAQPDFWRLPE